MMFFMAYGRVPSFCIRTKWHGIYKMFSFKNRYTTDATIYTLDRTCAELLSTSYLKCKYSIQFKKMNVLLNTYILENISTRH